MTLLFKAYYADKISPKQGDLSHMIFYFRSYDNFTSKFVISIIIETREHPNSKFQQVYHRYNMGFLYYQDYCRHLVE